MEQRWASLVVNVGLLAAWSKSLWQSWLCLCIMFVNKLHTVCNSWIASVSTQETINGLCWTVTETSEIMRGNLALELGIVAVFLVPWGYCNQNKLQQDKLTFASFNFSLTLPLNSIPLTTWLYWAQWICNEPCFQTLHTGILFVTLLCYFIPNEGRIVYKA